MTAKQRAALTQIAIQLETLAIAFHDAADGVRPIGGNISPAIDNTAEIVAVLREAFAQ